jgi:uncharacterized protein YqgV (UPF0045/DUF77 family)
MILTIEISLYPNNENFIPPIDSFIARLNSYGGVKVKTFPTATIVQGEYDLVMNILKTEMKPHREQHGMGVFVTKFIPGYEAL